MKARSERDRKLSLQESVQLEKLLMESLAFRRSDVTCSKPHFSRVSLLYDSRLLTNCETESKMERDKESRLNRRCYRFEA